MNTPNTRSSAGRASGDPATGDLHDAGDHGDGAGGREPAGGGESEGARKARTGREGDPATTTFDRSSEITDLIDNELADLDKPDAALEDDDTGTAGEREGDEQRTTTSTDGADDGEDEPEAETPAAKAKRLAKEEAEANGETADDLDGETGEGDGGEKPEGDKPPGEKPAEADPDMPDAKELAGFAKPVRKRIERLMGRVHQAEKRAKIGNSIVDFAERNHMPPPVFKDWLQLGAEVVGETDGKAAAVRLSHEVAALADENLTEDSTPAQRAAVLRRLADDMDPEGAKPPEPTKLPDDLADLVETGTLSKEDAEAAFERRQAKAGKGKPATTTTKAADAGNKPDATKIANQQAAARDARGKAEVKRIQDGYAKRQPELWKKALPLVRARLKEWKGAPPEHWGRIVEREAKIALQEVTPAKRSPPPATRPSGGRASREADRDDLDKILDEA